MQRLKFCFSGTYQLMGPWISVSLAAGADVLAVTQFTVWFPRSGSKHLYMSFFSSRF